MNFCKVVQKALLHLKDSMLKQTATHLNLNSTRFVKDVGTDHLKFIYTFAVTFSKMEKLVMFLILHKGLFPYYIIIF